MRLECQHFAFISSSLLTPDYNPIEHYLANLNRKFGKTNNNFQTLLDCIEFNFV